MNNSIISNPSLELINLYSFSEWRQRIHLYDNVFTPGYCFEYEWDFCLPKKKILGKSFIDVGANDGMFSFLAEKNGAKSVTSVDLYIEEHDTNLDMQKGWNINKIKSVKKMLNSNITITPCSVYELSSLGEKFDVVYCGNVLAWLQDQYEALKQLAGVTTSTLILRDDVSRIKGVPALEYINNEKLNTCIFNANKEFYIKYLSSLGFKTITFQLIDEFHLYEKRWLEFPSFKIKKSSPVYNHPFLQNNLVKHINIETTNRSSTQINGYWFFNSLGWVPNEYVKASTIAAIPTNPIKKELFKRKFKKEGKENYIITATR